MKSIDHFLRIGTTHKVCEDYIISGIDRVPFVILADGCSSSNDTDIGARILVHLAKQYLKNIPLDFTRAIGYHRMGWWIISSAKKIIETMGLNQSCLDATLIISYIANESIHTYIYGDGFLIAINLNDEISFFKISYSNNIPYYLSYRIDSKRDDLYKKINPIKTVNNVFKIYDPETEIQSVSIFEPYNSPFISVLSTSDYKGIFIASDGLESFIDKNGEKYNFNELLKEVTSFKNINGEFIKRRMGSKKGVINTLQLKDISHYDDLSIGGFML